MNIEDLEVLLAAATPGPWMVRRGPDYWWVSNDATKRQWECCAFDDGSACGEYGDNCTPETRDAIVALMNAAPALLRVAKAAVAWATWEDGDPEEELRLAVEALESE